MSFSSILAGPDDHQPSPNTRRKHSVSSVTSVSQNGGSPQRPYLVSAGGRKSSDHSRQTSDNTVNYLPPPNIAPKSTQQLKAEKAAPLEDLKMNGDSRPSRPSLSTRDSKLKIVISEKELQAAIAKLDTMEMSDIDGPGFEDERQRYRMATKKRKRKIEEREHDHRRVRDSSEFMCHYVDAMLTSPQLRETAMITKLEAQFALQATKSWHRYQETHHELAQRQIAANEAAEEKERKKVAQRNRRRETNMNKAQHDIDVYEKKLAVITDPDERERLSKDKVRAERKVASHQRLLYGEPHQEVRDGTPLAHNLDGGVMSTFQAGEDSIEPPKKKTRIGMGRLKKSKEQRQAEKDSAAAAQAAIDRGEDVLMQIAPKLESQRQKRDTDTKEKSILVERGQVSGKAHDQMLEAIWRDIAKKDISKVHRIRHQSKETKETNLRKTATLASKEARRWQLKTNKGTKEAQARSKRVMREMLGFWKRNERDERDQRKMAEKQELEAAKQKEKEREDNRQKRKLNFLISQTELYSHFIGKKVKTDEIERATDDVTPSGQTMKPAAPGAHTVQLPDSESIKPASKVTNFDQLDFDADDESALHAAAMANAQHAVQEAQDRARAFDNEGKSAQEQFDEGEMNFQNPTSLQGIDIPQPRMLSCQLKEYQLKGLNWLVNLYEQGINGILADEMGLGKTVQSISVMSYLAERHNIWGPFLVIAPASTLHNWQQEIVRFVPTLKVLPYWGSAKDRKVLRKYWDRKHITYDRDSPFHVLVTSYQLVVQDAQYFQKVKWQYMILDEAQAIKSAQSSRWKSLLSFSCRNRLLLTGTPIQNNMQELWALLHFIMPSLFDSHDEFSEWFSKDIESHAQSNTRLNEDQLKRLHMILKPFMLRRIKKHVQKELGDKIEEDVFCDLTYRQRAYYGNLRNKISILDLIEKAAIGDDQDTATLMNLVMQFRKVCNHPDLFERADTTSPFSFGYFAETASFLREGHSIEVGYSVRSMIELALPRRIAWQGGRLDLAGPENERAGWRNKWLYRQMNIFGPDHVRQSSKHNGAFSWLRFVDASPSDLYSLARKDAFGRAMEAKPLRAAAGIFDVEDGTSSWTPTHRLFDIVSNRDAEIETKQLGGGVLHDLFNVANSCFLAQGLNAIEPCARRAASAPPVELYAASQGVIKEKQRTFFNVPIRRALFGISEKTEQAFLESNLSPSFYPRSSLLPEPISNKGRYTSISVPSMRRFVTDSGKLAKLDQLLGQLKEGGHRVLLYFQMTRMIDLMEEYLTYRNYKYCRLDGSTKLEDRRDTVADFQTRDDIFIFLLSTRAGGLGINLTAADTVIFYDSDWNPTIDSQAMDRAHRLGQTKQVTVYRMITRGTIEERIRRRALQKEEVQRVVISGGAGATVDFNTKRENRTKDIAMWLADDDQAAEIEKKEAEILEKEAKEPAAGKKSKKQVQKKAKEVSLDDMYHEGE